jgi:hypothetical protein
MHCGSRLPAGLDCFRKNACPQIDEICKKGSKAKVPYFILSPIASFPKQLAHDVTRSY